MRTRTIALLVLLAGLAIGSWGCSKGGVDSPCREQQDCKSGLTCCGTAPSSGSIGTCKTNASCTAVDGGLLDGGADASTPSEGGIDAAVPPDAGSARDAGVDAGTTDAG